MLEADEDAKNIGEYQDDGNLNRDQNPTEQNTSPDANSSCQVVNSQSNQALASPDAPFVMFQPCCVNSYFTLDKHKVHESLNFKQILALFNCAISQEQAWAVVHQCLIELKFLLENNLELLILNQEDIDINLINFVQDGSILFGFKNTPSKLFSNESLLSTQMNKLQLNNSISEPNSWSISSFSLSLG